MNPTKEEIEAAITILGNLRADPSGGIASAYRTLVAAYREAIKAQKKAEKLYSKWKERAKIAERDIADALEHYID